MLNVNWPWTARKNYQFGIPNVPPPSSLKHDVGEECFCQITRHSVLGTMRLIFYQSIHSTDELCHMSSWNSRTCFADAP